MCVRRAKFLLTSLHSLVDAISRKSLQIFPQLPTTRHTFSPTLIHSFTFSKLTNTVCILSITSKHQLLHFIIKHHRKHSFIMSSKSNTHVSEENAVTEPQETNTFIPKMIEPITTVPPTKPKNKTSTKSVAKKKKLLMLKQLLKSFMLQQLVRPRKVIIVKP